MAESQIDPAFAAWQESNPEWRPITEYQDGDVLLGFDDDQGLALGSRRENGSWVQFVDGVTLRLCGPECEGDDDTIGHFVTPRVPTRFSVVPREIAILFMTH